MTDLNYLETDYLTVPYAGGVTSKITGVQFEAVNTKDQKLGVQFSGLNQVANIKGIQSELVNTKVNLLGSQFEALAIDKPDALYSEYNAKIDTGADSLGIQFMTTTIPAKSIGEYLTEGGYLEASYSSPIIGKFMGTQFEAINSKDKTAGAQFEGHITINKNTGAQFEGRITTDKSAGSQFEAFVLKKLSAQFRAVLYNTTQLRFMYDFPSRGVTGTNWTATSTATSASDGFSVNNLNTDIVEQVWRSADTSVQTLVCDTEDNAGVFLDTLAILNHNLTLGAQVILTGSDDSNFSSTPFVEFLKVETKNMYYISEQLPLAGYRYWKLDIIDAANPDGYMEIGTVVFGSSVVFSTESNFTDQLDFGVKQFQDKIFTEGFTNVSNDSGQKKFLSLDFKSLDADGRNFSELRKMFERAGSLLKILWVPVPKDPSRYATFAKMNEVPKEKHNYKGESYVSLKVNTDESN